MTELDKTAYELAHSVASTIYRRYNSYTERSDIEQECITWALSRSSYINFQLTEPDTDKRKHNEQRIAWQMRRIAERYARKEKAVKSGYLVNDEAYYESVIVAQLLPFVIASIQNNTVIEQPLAVSLFPIPKRFSFKSYKEAEEFVKEQPYYFKGLMLKCDNMRSKICNEKYEQIKALRGNSSNLRYVYYSLRKTDNEKIYSDHFPNHFKEYEEELSDAVKLLHTSYIECFIKKVKPLKMYDRLLKPHLYDLHMIYLHHLRMNKKYVNKAVIWEYIDKSSPAQLVSLTLRNLPQN